MRIMGITVLLAFLLQSCGHKGPLFLPPAEPLTQPSPSQDK
jgi:predicted small lipoprotein YifL